MDMREQIRYRQETRYVEMMRVPEWAKAEKMERSESLWKLWNLPGAIKSVSDHGAAMIRHLKKICRCAKEMGKAGDVFLFNEHKQEASCHE